MLDKLGMASGRVVATLLAVFAAFPIVWMVLSAFKSQQESFAQPPTYLPQHPTFSAFIRVWTESKFPLFFRNSLIIGVSVTIVVMVLSIMAVFSLNRVKVPGAEVLARSTLVFYSLPPILLVVPIVQIFLTLHFVDSLPSLIVAYSALYLPLGVWILRGYFSGLDRAPEEAAMVDGLSALQAFVRIGVHGALPGLAIVAFFTFNATWNEYLYASLLIQSNDRLTMSAGLSTFIGEVTIYSWPMLMAAGVMAVLPVLIFYLLVERHARRAVV